MSKIAGIGTLLLLAASAVLASEASPYLGQQNREIKALSPQETQDYLDGKGMGFAKAAELNHFPGPLHVLQLAEKLELTPDQRARTERIRAAMQHDATALGKALVDKEWELDRSFASGAIDPEKLRLLVTEIGRLQAEVRVVHLKAHLDQKAILTAAQLAGYDELRGYVTGSGPPHSPSAHGH